MSEPTEEDWSKLVRLAKYLHGKPRCVVWYEFQDEPLALTAYTDSDFAGCRRPRRSTSGGCIVNGLHVIKAWSKTQALIALSW